MFEKALLKGKRILVTGGGTGIGNAMARRCAQLGARVYIASRRKDVISAAAETMSKETRANVTGHVLDVRCPENVQDLIEEIWNDGGALTGLVNSAAGNFIARTEDISLNGFHSITDVQFRGPFYTITACGKRWIRDKVKASVVSVIDAGVWSGNPYAAPSTMAKAGVNNLTQSLAVEWGRYGIRLNAIAPGVFRTEGSAKNLDPLLEYGWNPTDNPMNRMGNLDEIGNLGAFLLADGAEFMTGQTIAIDGGAFLASGATFSTLNRLDRADWANVKKHTKQATDR